MSLLLELEIPGLDWELLERLAAETDRDGLLGVGGPRRRRWSRSKPRPYLLIDDVLDDGASVFDDEEVDADDAAISPAGREPLARTLLFLGESLEPGWAFHAGWIGDDDREVEISAAALAELARDSKLDGRLKYRVLT